MLVIVSIVSFKQHFHCLWKTVISRAIVFIKLIYFYNLPEENDTFDHKQNQKYFLNYFKRLIQYFELGAQLLFTFIKNQFDFI